MRTESEQAPAAKSDLSLFMGCLLAPAILFGGFCVLLIVVASFVSETEPEIENNSKTEHIERVVLEISKLPTQRKQRKISTRNVVDFLRYGMDIEAANDTLGIEGNLESLMSGNGRKLESYSWTLPNGKTLLGKFKNGLLDDWSIQKPPPPPPTEQERAQQLYLQELEAEYNYMMQKAQNLNVVVSLSVSGSLIKIVVGNGFYQLPFQGKKDLAKLISQYHIENGNSPLGTVVFYNRYDNNIVGEFYGGLQGKFL